VHDENGKVDPAKSAEPTRPRGSATSKRPARVSNDFETNSKRPKTSANNDLDGLIDPALTSSFLPQQQAQPEPSLQDASRLMQSAADAIRLSTSEMNNVYGGTFFHPGQKVAPSVNLDPRNQFERIPSPNDLDVKAEHESPMLQHSSTQLSNGTLVSPPDSTGDGVDFPGTANEGAQSATSPDGGDSTSLDHGGHIVTPSSASRHSSRQPKSVVRYVPDSFATKASSSKRSEEGNFQMHERRASSSAASTLTAVTDPSRRPSSNTSAMGDGSVAPMRKSSIEIKIPSARAASTDSVAVIDDADERLARELHAQWNGSVRRSTRP
jgi:F-box/leucine-rich repeat protein 10/11